MADPCRTCPMRERIKLLEAIILDGAPVPDPSMERAVEASLRGDWGPLMRINEERKRRGGDARQMATDNLSTRHTAAPLFEKSVMSSRSLG